MALRIVLASRNQHKLIELRRMLDDTEVELIGLDEAAPGSPELTEEEDTFAGNAMSKAKQAGYLTGLPALADDSGLEVDALDGAPGVRSARFAGGHGDSEANTALLLEKLHDVPTEDRAARFRCVAALFELGVDGAEPVEHLFDGICEGQIGHEPRGSGGFGYDPVFVLPDRNVTVAQLTDDEKDTISHRGRAIRKLRAFLDARFSDTPSP